MTARARVLTVLLCAAVPRAASGQARRGAREDVPVRLVAFSNAPTEPELGEVFSLRLTVRLAPNVVAFFPDTLLAAHSAFSAGKGEWSTIPGPADSVDVHAIYPVMGLLSGGVELPSLELWTRAAAPGETGGPQGVSTLSPPPTEAAPGDLRHSLLYVGGALILPLREMAEEDALTPRPAADVEGGQWSLGFFLALALLAVAVALLARLIASRMAKNDGAPVAGDHGFTSKAEALRELDRIKAMGWHTNGRIVDFYDATTGVLRRYSGRHEPEGGVAMTSTELMGHLQDRWGDVSVDALRSAVWVAERVKFGEYRPAPDSAEADWTTVRDWVDRTPEE